MTQRLTANQVIELLNLQPLPGEGGYYRQTHAAPGPDGHPATSAILYLVTPESWSALHRLASDEMFHAYLGDACTMVVCTAEGTVAHHMLGSDLVAGEHPQVLVPRGTWQGTRLVPGGDHGYALLGTTMTPGYRQDQFELATGDDLTVFDAKVQAELRPYLAPDHQE